MRKMLWLVLLAFVAAANPRAASALTVTTSTILHQSYDFSLAAPSALEDPSGGDLYFLPETCTICVPADEGKFWANNIGQNGLQDVGPGDLLDIASIPGSGYTRFGVEAIVGNSYISLAEDGEAGFFIFFEVTALDASSVTIDWIYSNVAPALVPEPPSLLMFSAMAVLLAAGLSRTRRRG